MLTHAAKLEASYVLAIDPNTYKQQLEDKVQNIETLFSDMQLPPLQVFSSPPSHYRGRAEFRVWHEGPQLDYVMFDCTQTPPRRITINSFPVGTRLMNQIMVDLRKQVLTSSVLRDKLYQVNFHTSLSGEALVTMIYHKKLGDPWEEAAGQLQQDLCSACDLQPGRISIVGRSRGQKVTLGRDYVTEVFDVDGNHYQYVQMEGSFSQPNPHMCEMMLTWAKRVTQHSGGDLLELYCGNGNFTIPLAGNFRQVIATEVSKTSVAAARQNMELNHTSNVLVARMSSEEFTEAWRTRAQKRRLEGLDWEQVSFQTLLVDPPRAGLDEATVQLMTQFDRIVYISCNPITLHENLVHVKDSHVVEHFAVFDQFPYTHHVECGVYLRAK